MTCGGLGPHVCVGVVEMLPVIGTPETHSIVRREHTTSMLYTGIILLYYI